MAGGRSIWHDGSAEQKTWADFQQSIFEYIDEAVARAVAAILEPGYAPLSPKLRWAPPPQVSPTIVSVPEGFYSGSFGPTEDVIFDWPASVRFSEFICTGGRHLRIIGGASAKSGRGSALQFVGCAGSVFLEGLDLDMVGANADGINACGSSTAPYALRPDVYIQNCLITKLNGSEATNHTDAFQAQGAIGTLYVDRVTISSNHQGIAIFQDQFPTTAAYISRLNGRYTGPGQDRAVTYLLWNFEQGSSAPYAPVYLDEAYFEPRAGQDLSQCVFPAPGLVNSDGLAIGVMTSDGWATASWPAITNCHGIVKRGSPPGGDWCAPSSAGVAYVSPGYQ